ncbi:MAG: hypothetical protein AAF495_14190 [Pseudomonadota bacterium]
MYKLSRPLQETLAAPALLAAAFLYSGPAGAAPPATDLDCTKCVESAELLPGIIGPRELADDAVFVTTVLVRADGTPEDNCNALLDALVDTSIATETDPYLIKLEPGIYNCPFPLLVEMNSYVDIEGSGQNTTIIRGHRDPVVEMAAHSELRQVTVDAHGLFPEGVEMRYTDTRLADVTVIANIGKPGSIPLGVQIGSAVPNPNQPAEIDLDHVTVRAGLDGKLDPFNPSYGTAIKVGGLVIVHMTDVHAKAANSALGLVSLNSARVVATGSVFQGAGVSMWVETTNTAVMVSSQLIGPLGIISGVARCISSYNFLYNDLNPDCTP